MKRVLFGAGKRATTFLDEALRSGEVLGVIDNDPKKWGTTIRGIPILSPNQVWSFDWDEVVISSTATIPIYRCLLRLGVQQDKIRAPLLSPTNRARWESLRNAQNGRRVFVIGNGPSLSTADLDRLHSAEELTFAFNKIYLAFEETEYRPTYYLVEDNLVAENCAERIRNLDGFTKFFADYLVPVFGPPDPETILFNLEVQPPEQFVPKFSQEALLIHSGYTCTYSAIQLALWMGCNPIILIGVDFYFRPAQEAGGKKLVHHGEQNHFLPNYREEGELWNPPFLEQTESAYQLARKVATERGVEILNATRGGYLEVFPRVNFDDLF